MRPSSVTPKSRSASPTRRRVFRLAKHCSAPRLRRCDAPEACPRFVRSTRTPANRPHCAHPRIRRAHDGWGGIGTRHVPARISWLPCISSNYTTAGVIRKDHCSAATQRHVWRARNDDRGVPVVERRPDALWGPFAAVLSHQTRMSRKGGPLIRLGAGASCGTAPPAAKTSDGMRNRRRMQSGLER